VESSLSLLSASLEYTADGILIVDRNGKFARWNQKFADMWKIPEEVLSSRDDEKSISATIFLCRHLKTVSSMHPRVRFSI
jgi:PAS domain-containing protein